MHLDTDRSVEGVMTRGRWFGAVELREAAWLDGGAPVLLDGVVVVPRARVVFWQVMA